MKNIGTLLAALLVPLIVPIVMRALRRSAVADHAPEAAAVSLRYGVPMKVLGVMSFWLGVFAIGAPLFTKTRSPVVFSFLFTVPIGASALFVFLETFFVQHRADPEGVTCGRVFRRPILLKWAELRSVEYNPSMSWFVLRSVDGKVGRVSLLIGGVRGFAVLALAHVERNAFTQLSWKYANVAASGKSIATAGRSNSS